MKIGTTLSILLFDCAKGYQGVEHAFEALIGASGVHHFSHTCLSVLLMRAIAMALIRSTALLGSKNDGWWETSVACPITF